MQTLEDLEAILKVCRDAGIQLMDGELTIPAFMPFAGVLFCHRGVHHFPAAPL